MILEELPTENYYSDCLSERKGWVYILKTPKGFKIGKSHGIKGRMKQLEKEFNKKVEIIHYIHFDGYLHEKEKAFHTYFSNKNNGYKLEYFDLNNDDIELIKNKSFLDEISKIASENMKDAREKHTKEYLRRTRKLVKKRNEALLTLSKLNKDIKESLSLYRIFPHRLEDLTEEGKREVLNLL